MTNRKKKNEMYVDAKRLRQLIYNVLLFTPGKLESRRSPSEGLVTLRYDNSGSISFSTTDGYTAMASGNCESSQRVTNFVSGEDLKLAEKELRSLEGEVQVTISGDTVFIGKVPLAIKTPSDHNLWEAAGKILQSDIQTEMLFFDRFALNGQRVSKLSLLEPRDTYPIDFKIRDSVMGQTLLVWKHGPNSIGVFAPLDREQVAAAYESPWEALWV